MTFTLKNVSNYSKEVAKIVVLKRAGMTEKVAMVQTCEKRDIGRSAADGGRNGGTWKRNS